MANTDFIDCQTIIKAFEKGCAYSTDERAVFALATPFLQDTMVMSDATQRTAAQAYSKKLASIDQEILSELGGIQSQYSTETILDYTNVPQGMDGISSSEGSLDENIASVDEGAGNNKVKAWLLDKVKECIPCDLRVMAEDIKNYKWGAKATASIDQMGDTLQLYWTSAFERIMDLINMFRNLSSYIDICALIKWMKDYVCVPDLYKILAALSALLIDICGIIDGFGIDLAISLVAPLILPSLQAVVSVLTDFLLLILKPLQCIIESIEKMMRKLDFSAFRIPSHVTLRAPKWVARGGSDYWTSDATRDPQQEHELGTRGKFHYPETRNLDKMGTWEVNKTGVSFRMNEDYARDASVYHRYDLPNIEEYTKFMKEKADWVNRLNTCVNTMFGDLVYFLKAAIGRFEKMIRDVLDELMKLIQEYILGFSFSLQRAATQKLAILQLLKVVSFFINLHKIDECNEEDAEVSSASYITKVLSNADGYLAYQDDQGNIHIEEPDEAVQSAREILGTVLNTSEGGTFGGDGAQQTLQKPISQDDLRQTVFSTADPVLNAKLADIVEKITTPVKVVFGCSFDISSVDVDKYNEWILG